MWYVGVDRLLYRLGGTRLYLVYVGILGGTWHVYAYVYWCRDGVVCLSVVLRRLSFCDL